MIDVLDSQPLMPTVELLRQQNIVSDLLDVLISFIDQTQNLVACGSTSLRLIASSSSAIMKQSLSFLVTLLTNVEHVTLHSIQQTMQYLRLLCQLPGFIEHIVSNPKSSKLFLSACGLEMVTKSSFSSDFPFASFREDLDSILLSLLKSAPIRACREQLVKNGLLLVIVNTICRLYGRSDPSESLASISAVSKSVFFTHPWVTARAIDQKDGSFLFTPVSNHSNQTTASGANIHTGFKVTPNPLLTASIAATKTYVDKEGCFASYEFLL
jgi:hypothetical protein